MKNIIRLRSIFLTGLIFTITVSNVFSQIPNCPDIIYVSPKPGSIHNHPATNILIKCIRPMNIESVLNRNTIFLKTGSKQLEFNVKILEDKKTIIIHPLNNLPADEKIEVLVKKSILCENGNVIEPFKFNFYISGKISGDFVDSEPMVPRVSPPAIQNSEGKTLTGSTSIIGKVNSQYPINVMVNNNPGAGYYFVSTFSYNSNYPNRAMILDSKGKIVYDRMRSHYVLDFKQLTNTTFCYADFTEHVYYVLNSRFQEFDTIRAGNGYLLDIHELQVDKNNGHYFILAQENVEVDMSDSVDGGNPRAMVLGMIVQELDENKNVVFEWKTLDHLPITATKGQNLKANKIDYAHCNAIELDTDTTFLLSSRHLNEIERVDRRTGKLIWRMGTDATYNDFTFYDDTIGFTYQHDIRRLPNGNITLYDNGNLRGGDTSYSRALEYELDEDHKTARLVWQYRSPLNTYGGFMGSVQRLSDGNTLIGWGGNSITFTEVNMSKNKVMEVSIAPWAYSYRAFKFDIQETINLNQIPLIFDDTLPYCNEDSITVFNNLASAILPVSIPEGSYEIQIKNNLATVYTETFNNFFNKKSTYLDFTYDQLTQKDTTICLGSSLQLNGSNKCGNLKYKWSTLDSSLSINVSPKLSTTYWLEMTHGNYRRTDSVRVNITSVPNFSILGSKTFTVPYQVMTYSVPYNPSNSYSWDVFNGNIISGYNTNSVNVQLDNVDSIWVSTQITNAIGCINNAKITITPESKASGLIESQNRSEFNVFPNPASDNLNISSPYKNFQYKLVDLTGRIIMKSDVSFQQNPVQLDIRDLPNGLYMLYLNSGDKRAHLKIEKF
ncbi:MAG: aryl-sulfate sulfotransferase [Bacteroidota bacterium]|nr:aryl-sulfate sulfotransferase [Bacteroidota bacterium]